MLCPPPVFAPRGGGRAMRGSLGEKIGEGTMADIHAWAPGQVLKLFKAGVPRRFGEHEARMTRAVFAAGAPAPEVFDEVTLEGRFGIVLTRLDGPTLWQLLLTRAMTSEQAGAILATLSYLFTRLPAAGRALPAQLVRLRIASPRRYSGTYRHWRPHPDRAPAAGGRAVPCRPSRQQCDHDGGWSKNHRLGRFGPRGRGSRPRALPCFLFRPRLRPRRHGSGTAARAQRGRAGRVRAAGRRVPRGADAGDGALPANPPRLRPRRTGDQPCPAGVADPTRRSEPVLGGLIGQPQAHPRTLAQWIVRTRERPHRVAFGRSPDRQ